MFLSKRGHSLVEVIIAAGFLIVAAGGLTYFISGKGTKTSHVLASKACLLHVGQVISQFTQIGANGDSLDVVGAGATLNLSSGDPLRRLSLSSSEHIRGIVDGHRLMTAVGHPGAPELLEPGTPPILRTAHLTNGSLAAVQTIYNEERRKGNGICNSPGVDYSDTSLPFAERLFENNVDYRWHGEGREAINVATTVRIQTMDALSGQPSCLSAPVIALPRGVASPPPAVAAGLVQIPGVAGAPVDSGYNFQENLGYLLTVRATYQEPDPESGVSTTKYCETSQKFLGVRDASAPSAPDVSLPAVVNLNGTNQCNVIDRSSVNFSFQKTIGFAISPANRGSVILCRDQSLRRLPVAGTVDPSYSGTHPGSIRTELCATENHEDNYVPPNPPVSYVDGNGTNPIALRRSCFVRRDPDGTQTYDPADPYGISPIGNWQPCHLLQICNSNSGGPIAASSVSLTHTGSEIRYTMNFAGLSEAHLGCDIRVDAVAVDPAGNMSAIRRVVDEPLHADLTHEPGLDESQICWDQANNFFHSSWNNLGAPSGTYYHSCTGGCQPPCTVSGSQTFSTPGSHSLTVDENMSSCKFTFTVKGAGGSAGGMRNCSGGSGGGMQFDYEPQAMGTFDLFVGGAPVLVRTTYLTVVGGGAGGSKVPFSGGGISGGGGGASAVKFGSTLLSVVGGGGGAGGGGGRWSGCGGRCGSGGDGGGGGINSRGDDASGIPTAQRGRGGGRIVAARVQGGRGGSAGGPGQSGADGGGPGGRGGSQSGLIRGSSSGYNRGGTPERDFSIGGGGAPCNVWTDDGSAVGGGGGGGYGGGGAGGCDIQCVPDPASRGPNAAGGGGGGGGYLAPEASNASNTTGGAGGTDSTSAGDGSIVVTWGP